MLNYIWAGMIILGFFIAALNGRIEQTTQAAIQSAQSAVEICIGLMGVLCMWTGLMKIAEKSGLVQALAKVIRPVLRLLFPEVPEGHPAAGAIVMNLVANILGLGNAATPLGLKAMSELQKLNRMKDTATDAMCMFLVINTSSIQLIPATVIALRTAAASINPAEIIGTVWIATLCATTAGVTAAKLLSFGRRRKRYGYH